jgi:hypothetical protein
MLIRPILLLTALVSASALSLKGKVAISSPDGNDKTYTYGDACALRATAS